MIPSALVCSKMRQVPIEALEARRLLSVTIPVDYELIATVTFDSKSEAFKAVKTDMAAGTAYVVVASGTPRIGYTPSGGTRRTDAKYHDAQNESGIYSQDPIAGRNAGRFVFAGVEDPDTDGTFDWGPLQSDHVYAVAVTGLDTTFTAKFADSYYADNNGIMSLKLYQQVQFDSLTVADADNAANIVTADEVSPVEDLYVPEQSSGDATIKLSAAFTPPNAGSRVLWTVDGASASPASLNFAGSPEVTLTPEDDNYDFVVQAGVDDDGDGMLSSYEITRTVNVHVYSAELQFNATEDTSDDLVRLSSPSFGPYIPASQPVLDTAVRIIGTPPPGLMISLDNPDGRVQFGTDAPSTVPVSPPPSPIATTSATEDFSATGGGWLHLPVVGVSQSASVADASVRVVVSGGGAAAGTILSLKGVTVFWFNEATMDVVADQPYTMQGQSYEAADDRAVAMAAEATLRPAGLNTNAPQLANLRIGIVQNVNSDFMRDIYSDPQMTWNANYPDGTPIPAGTHVDIPAVVSAGVNVALGAAKFPLLDTRPEQPDPAPLYGLKDEALAIPFGYPGGGSALADDGPDLPVPARRQPDFPIALPISFVFDNANNLVGTATYYQHVKATRLVTYADWCMLVDTTGGAVTLVAALAQNQWQVDLDSSIGNQSATAGQSHIPNAIPILTGPAANTFGRDLNYPTPHGAGQVGFIKPA